jgi:uncharacterized Zn finger protein (UPF0148 family)
MFCPQCGNDVKDGAKFCGNCGWAVPAASAHNAQPAEQHCASCGTALKEGAKFCPNCGGVVAAPAVSEPVPPSEDAATKADKPESKTGGKKSGAIDKAVFYHLGKQVYACYLYKGGVIVGNMTDTQGAFIPDVQEWLENKYDNLVVEIKEKE